MTKDTPVRHEEIAAAARVLDAGGIVAYPTETVYGLGVDARSRRAVEALIAWKGRDAGRGISVLVASLDMAAPLLDQPLPEGARALAARFWPGPLTIVLPASPAVDDALRGPSGGIGLRCSSDPWAAALVEQFGAPLTSTSANRSGEEPARCAADVRNMLAATAPREAAANGQRDAASNGQRDAASNGQRDADRMFVLDGGARHGSSVSTVVEFSKGRATVLRVGAIGPDAIASVLNPAEKTRG